MKKPPNSPPCWSTKYQDGDPDCSQCSYRDSCRSALLAQVTLQKQSAVPLLNQPDLQQAKINTPTTSKSPTTASTHQPTVQQFQPFLSDSINQNPSIPTIRPGAQGPAYYFTRYPGESVSVRLGKNMALRVGEAVFRELMFFFRHWTWPPKS